MKVILYMAISANGYIAREDDDTGWISGEEWNSYSKAARKSGCLVVGHRTYDILTKQPEYEKLEKVKIVVVSNKNFKTLASNHLIARNPKEALNLLTDFKEVLVAGGGILNSSFMKENLIDEIYLDVEPLILGKGISMFEDADFEAKLVFVETKKLSDNEVQLHYKVIK